MKGKFGRVLGNFTSINGEKCAAVLIREGHAVAYQGGSKENVASQHLANRERLVKEGKVVIPEELKSASVAPVKNPAPLEANDAPIIKTGVPNPNEYKSIPKALRTKRVMKKIAKEEKAKSAAKKKTAKKK